MAQESDVVRIAREYREQLARNESEALRRIARLWVKMERGLQSGYEDLAREVLARMARGEMVPRQFIYTMQRYQSMMDQIRKEMPYYQGAIEDLVTDYQKENYTLGLDASQAIIKASRPSDDTWTRINKDATETMAGFAGNGAPLHSLLHRDYNQTAENVLDALIEGVGLGKGYREVARDMQDAMGGDFDRAMRIARTEMNRSYRLANADQYRASGVVTKVIRLCYKPTACFACLMLDGEECEDFICDDHPNGKCTTIVQTTGGIMPEWETGREWLEEQTEEDQRRIMGAGRFDLWKQQGVDPRSMVYIKDNPIWGGSPTVRTLEDLLNSVADPGKYFRLSGATSLRVSPPDFIPYKFIPQSAEGEAKFEALNKELQEKYGFTLPESVTSLDYDSVKASLDGVLKIFDELPEIRSSFTGFDVDKNETEGLMYVTSAGKIIFSRNYYAISTKENLTNRLIFARTYGLVKDTFDESSIGRHEAGHILVQYCREHGLFGAKTAQNILNKAVKRIPGKTSKTNNLKNQIINAVGKAASEESLEENFCDIISYRFDSGRSHSQLSIYTWLTVCEEIQK